MNPSLSHAPSRDPYDARLEADEDEARLDCGCFIARTDDGGFVLSFCSLHAEASTLRQVLTRAKTVFNGQHNLLSTATDEERRTVVEKTLEWWNHGALPVLERTGGLSRGGSPRAIAPHGDSSRSVAPYASAPYASAPHGGPA